jgi:hypothetical protein
VMPCACDDQIIEVCGADGNTYGNACLAMCAGTEAVSNGPCNPNGCVEAADCGDAGEFCSFRCIMGQCSPNCGPACENDGDCAAGQLCDGGHCAGAPDCPDPLMEGVRVLGRSIEECRRIEADDALSCNDGEELYNDACGCGCVGDGGQMMMCDCPEGGDPVCGLNGVQYPNRCEAECIGVDANPGPCNGCQEFACDLACDGPFARSADGCEFCGCCEAPMCEMQCATGYERTPEGCDTCNCCPDISACALDCPGGYVNDEFGCDTCECRAGGVIIRMRDN